MVSLLELVEVGPDEELLELVEVDSDELDGLINEKSTVLIKVQLLGFILTVLFF